MSWSEQFGPYGSGSHSGRLEPVGTRIEPVENSGVRDISTCEPSLVTRPTSPRDERVDQLQHEFYPSALRPSLNRLSDHTGYNRVGDSAPLRRAPCGAAVGQLAPMTVESEVVCERCRDSSTYRTRSGLIGTM